MDMSSLISDPYIITFLGGIVFYFATLFLFVEKVKDVVIKKKEKHDESLIKKFNRTSATVQSVINMFDSLRDSRSLFERMEKTINGMHISGFVFLAGNVLGFILKQVEFNESIAMVIVGSGFLYFFVSLMFLLMWYWKNK